jgi:tetratricopeptide (TPR) repeat protein
MALVRVRLTTCFVCVSLGFALSGEGPLAQAPDALVALERSLAAAEQSLRADERQIAESHYRDALRYGWMIRGALDVGAGETHAAEAAFERASASAIENRDALRSLAIVRLQAGKSDAAVEILTQMASASPRDVQLKITLAQALVAMNKPGEAAQELAEAEAIAPAEPELVFALASGYLRIRKVEAAERLFAKVTAARPQPETYVLIGRTYRDFQYYDRARAALRRALKMNPRVRRAHYYLGTTALLEEGVVVLDEAIAEFRRELAIAPGDPLATLRLGVVLVEARQCEEALPLLAKSVREPSPPYDAWMYLGRCQLARSRAADAVTSFRKALATAEKAGQTIRRRSLHYQLATALRDSGASAEAAREFAEAERLSVEQAEIEREALTKFLADTPDAGDRGARSLPLGVSGFETLTPEQRVKMRSQVDIALARTYLNLGVIHAQAGRFARAAELLEVSASIDPGFPQVQYSLGVAYFNSEQYDKAAPALAKAREQQPQNAEANRLLALASINTEDYAKAVELLRKDPKLPTDPALQYAFGISLVRSGRADEAEKIFTRVLTQHPDVPELNVVIGQIHAAQGDFDQAVASLGRAIALKPDVPEAQATLGDIYMRQGRFGPAAEALRAELAAHPKNVSARNTLATVLELDGKSDEALKELRTVLAVKPNYAHARYLFGKILLARGEPQAALAHLEVAVKLAPDDANIHYQLGQAYQRLGRTEQAAQAFEAFKRLKDKVRGGQL